MIHACFRSGVDLSYILLFRLSLLDRVECSKGVIVGLVSPHIDSVINAHMCIVVMPEMSLHVPNT